MPGFFEKFFSSGEQGSGQPSNGGLAHGTNGSVTQLPAANPQSNLNGSNPQNNGVQPQQQQQRQEPVEKSITSQLDSMTKLWQTPTDANGKPVAPQGDPLRSQIFSFDPKIAQEQVSKLDFTTAISGEQLEKIVGQGGDVNALKDVLNTMARSIFLGTTANTSSLINDGFSKYTGNLDQSLPAKFRALQLASSRSEDPILSHPAVAPMAKSISQLIAQKAPHASADEIGQATQEFFDAIGAAYSAKSDGERQTAMAKVEDNIDWLKTMGLSK